MKKISLSSTNAQIFADIPFASFDALNPNNMNDAKILFKTNAWNQFSQEWYEGRCSKEMHFKSMSI